ncbi:MAG: flagellar motor switch protein FliM [Firmicutes bacterium]|nr:flagellar motor switch protein FliM [Bacillota bacterium]
MAEVLSQNEIDALLNALNSGELSAEEARKDVQAVRIRSYDFKRAMRFSKDHLRSISRIYEHAARLMSTYFSAQLRQGVQVSVASVDQLPYEEFIRSIPSVTVLHVLDVHPLGGKFLVEMPNNISQAVLDRLLGGDGQSPIADRRLTEIDMLVLERLMTGSLYALTSAWGGVADLTFVYDTLEVNPQFIQIANQTDVVLVVSLATMVGNQSGIMTICMPHIALEPLMGRLSARFAFASPRSHDQPELLQRKLQKHMDRVEVVLKAELGYTNIRLDELLELQPGDIITLDQVLGEPLYVKVGDEIKYRGQPGTSRGRYAARILQVVEEEEDGE